MLSSSKKLNDFEIRKALSAYLIKKNFYTYEILEELHVCNGRAIADLVTLKEGVHCYEIKGDGDRIERVIDQNRYYQKSFRRLSLVTTDKHLEKALKVTPVHWGIMIAKFNRSNEVIIKYVRRPKINNNFDMKLALLTLRKSELLELLPFRNKKIEQSSRDVLASMICIDKKNYQISRVIGNTLIARKKLYSSSDHKLHVSIDSMFNHRSSTKS